MGGCPLWAGIRGRVRQRGLWLVTECRGHEGSVRKSKQSLHVPGLALRKSQGIPGRQEDMGVGKLPGVGNWFFTRDAQGTETLGGWILPLWDISLSHHILGVQPYPVKMCLL